MAPAAPRAPKTPVPAFDRFGTDKHTEPFGDDVTDAVREMAAEWGLEIVDDYTDGMCLRGPANAVAAAYTAWFGFPPDTDEDWDEIPDPLHVV